MQKKSVLAAALACACIAQASMATAREAEPLTYRIAAIKWNYEPMGRAAAYYEENRARYAPSSSLRFRLPAQVKGAEGSEAVQLLGPDYSDNIPLDESRSFSLPKLSRGAAGDTFVVVDGYFNKGSYLPIPEVRTAALAPNSIRVGDVRLSCRTLVKYIRASKMSWNLVLGGLSAFSLDICANKEGPFSVKAPIPYNKVTWTDADRIVKVQEFPSVKREFEVPIGDAGIGNDTTVAFELAPDKGPAEQGTGAAQ